MAEARELTANALNDTTAVGGLPAENVVPTTLGPVMEIVGSEFKAIVNSDTSKLYFVGISTAEVLSDAFKLKTIFRNLIGNAVRFPDLEKPQHRIVVRTKVINHQVTVFVHDNGKGIGSSHLHKIWMPGFTTASTVDGQVGKGLGLSLVRAVCESLPGHRLSVRSAPGKGTSFMLVLPCALRRSARLSAKVSHKGADGLQAKRDLCIVYSNGNSCLQVPEFDIKGLHVHSGTGTSMSTDLDSYISLMELPLDVLILESEPSPESLPKLYKALLESQGFIPIVAIRRKFSRYQLLELGSTTTAFLFQVNLETLLELGSKHQLMAQRQIFEQ
jgi:hypothetical protein